MDFVFNQTGTWISLEWQPLSIRKHTVDNRSLVETMAYSTLLTLFRILITTGFILNTPKINYMGYVM